MKQFFKILFHLLIWISIPFVTSFFIWNYLMTDGLIRNEEIVAVGYFKVFTDNLLFNSITILNGVYGFYLSYLFITPRIFLKEKKLLSLLYILVWLMGPALVLTAFRSYFLAIDWFFYFFLLISYVVFFLFAVIGALFRVYYFIERQRNEKIRLEKENLNTQLSLFKAQIDQHFLFNTINNIDVLIETKPAVASAYLRKLSEILRFVLYKVTAPQIALKEEIDYLEKYVDLQRIRSTNPNFVKFQVEGEPKNIKVAPMVFIVFVENAIKYVADKKLNEAVKLKLQILPDRILFSAANNFIKPVLTNAPQSGGLGIESAKKRLNLFYKNQFNLQINADGGYFYVNLEINYL